jgi:hypothetical protein
MNKQIFILECIETDVVVVGGGVAGLCAAVSAARNNVKVVLINDRPVLGGNCSGEIGVPMNGSAYSPFNLWGRETGIVEEIRNLQSAFWGGRRENYWVNMQRVYMDLVEGESSNLSYFPNTVINEASTDKYGYIVSVAGTQLRAERNLRFTAKQFIDCTGDGTLGMLAGAVARHGREAKSEFNESMAPAVSDEKCGTMGATLLWRSIDAGYPVKFIPPSWAIDVSKLKPFQPDNKDYTRTLYRTGNGSFCGFWWAEYGGILDTIHDDGNIQDHLRKLLYGIWDYIKNSGLFDNTENQDLDWVAVLPGKRESRRLIGREILTENTWLNQKEFTDVIGFTGWPIDIHPPKGYMDDLPACTHRYLPGPCDLPLGALYSINVPNLFFAGRNISTSHIGLGSPRVIATTGVTGQAVGAAAALCVKFQLTANELSDKKIVELQQILLSQDQGIFGIRHIDDSDIAQSATISASSCGEFEQTEGDAELPLFCSANFKTSDLKHDYLETGAVVFIPADRYLNSISLCFRGNVDAKIRADIYTVNKPHNYRCDHLLKSITQKISNDGWANFPIEAEPGAGLKFAIRLQSDENAYLLTGNHLIPGTAAAGVLHWKVENGYDEQWGRLVNTPLFKTSPKLELLSPSAVVDGFNRPAGLPHLWMSKITDDISQEWLNFKWETPQTVCGMELLLDTQLNGEKPHQCGVSGTLLKDYIVYGISTDNQTHQLASIKNNITRRNVIKFAPIQIMELRLKFLATHGTPQVAVYSVKVFNH